MDPPTPTLRRPWLHRVADLRPGEGRPVLWALGQFFALLCSLYVVRPLRDEMGIVAGVDDMQWLFTGTLCVVLAVVPLYGWASARFGRRRLVLVLDVVLALAMVVLYVVARSAEPTWMSSVAVAIFVWISVFNLVAVSAFWSMMADLFEPEASRRLFGVVMAAGSAGALLGPVLAAGLVTRVEPIGLLLLSAGFLVLAGVCAVGLDRSTAGTQGQGQPLGGGLWAGVRLLVATPTLREIAVYLVLMTWVSTTLYFEQAHIVRDAVDSSMERTALFARMDLAVNLLSLAIQTMLTGRIIARFGLSSVLVVLPLISLLAVGWLAIAPSLSVLVVVQVARRASNYALSKPGREVLYTGVQREARYKAKNVVDTVVYRGGDALAGWGFAAARAAGLGLAGIAGLSVPVAIAWALVGRRLGRRNRQAVL